MSSLTFRSTQLPWSEDQGEKLFKRVLIALLAVVIVLGIAVPSITLPEIQREKLETIPPQLAKVIKRKKDKPKPPPVVKKIEKKIENPIEKKVEIKKEPIKKIQPKPIVKKVEVKPKQKPLKKERSPEKVAAAKEKAKQLINNFANELSDMQNMVDMNSLAVDSASLTNSGSSVTDVGSVVSQAAVDRVGGVDETQLTRETGAEQLAKASRDTTEVKAVKTEDLVDKPQETQVAGMNRSQMQIRRVFEQNKSRFDRIYRKALRSNPVLQGTVTLGIDVAASGEVNDCFIKSSDLQDESVMKRIASTCKRLSFDVATQADVFEYPLTFAP